MEIYLEALKNASNQTKFSPPVLFGGVLFRRIIGNSTFDAWIVYSHPSNPTDFHIIMQNDLMNVVGHETFIQIVQMLEPRPTKKSELNYFS